MKEKDFVSALSASFNAASNLEQSLCKTAHTLAHFYWLIQFHKPAETDTTEKPVWQKHNKKTKCLKIGIHFLLDKIH